MTTADLVAALRPVTSAFEAQGVRYFLGGSIASSAHGIARGSLDADVVAELGSADVEPLVRRLGGAYYAPIDQMHRAVVERRSFNLIHLTTMFKLDIFVSKGRPFDRSAADRARPHAIGDTDEYTVLVASAEDTILAKLEWFQLGGETSERQWWDIVGVLKVTDGADRDYLRKWAAALNLTELLERARLAAAD